jgi:hypothetical protein
MVTTKRISLLLASGILILFPSAALGHTCSGTMHHMMGDMPVTYEFDSADECAASYVGYVKYWGPGTDAWIEGTYTWDCYEEQNIKIIRMKFADEMNICKSFDDHNYSCWSNRSTMKWDITCEQP